MRKPSCPSVAGTPDQWGRIQRLPGNHGMGATTDTSQCRASRRIRSATKTPKAGCCRLGKTVLSVRTRMSVGPREHGPGETGVEIHVALDDARPRTLPLHRLARPGADAGPRLGVARQPCEGVN